VTDNSEALKRARRQDSNAKRRRASDALDAMIDNGEPITFPTVARRAGVSVSLLYADPQLAGRLSEARRRQRDTGATRTWRLPARSLVTEQSLRADLANTKDQIRRLNEEMTLLRERLARGFGADADTANGRATSPLIDQLQQQAADLEADNAQLRQDAVKLKGDLREANETLDAARAMNRELMAEINRPGQREDAPPAPTTSRPQRSRRSPSSV
jgi:chromosome segregation ATPase